MSAEYPEHDAMKKVSHLSQVVGDFIEWARRELAVRCNGRDLVDLSGDIEKTLAEYFMIDLSVIEKEKREMLESMRMTNSGSGR
jgi:hypothetical protein